MEPTPCSATKRSTPRASLAALGCYLHHLDFFGPIRTGIPITQKTVRYSPAEKLYDCFISLLTGAQTIAEVNTRLRPDPALQAACGRTGCAEQSVVPATLAAATETNVTELQTALGEIFRAHAAAARHDFAERLLILDADLSGPPCGPQAAFATPGYFNGQVKGVGRQLGRVFAPQYDEIVCDELYPGPEHLCTALPGLIAAAAEVLELTPAQKAYPVIRIAAGGGSQEDIRTLVSQGYQVLGQEYSALRTEQFAALVEEWIPAPRHPGRAIGSVPLVLQEAGRPVRRSAARCKRTNGQWVYGVLITTLDDLVVLRLLGLAAVVADDPTKTLCAYAYLYDQRGGSIEISFKEDNPGLGGHQRAKKRFPAQQMVVGLRALAHNTVIWARY